MGLGEDVTSNSFSIANFANVFRPDLDFQFAFCLYCNTEEKI